MADDRLQQYHLESVFFPVEEMESVVATVSGYHGSERFNLIKLISRTGASYIGSMNQSVTHLVCWKFEGIKYELAKKLKIPIVNHCWIEECVKRGKRVPEEPYTLKSGEEMGPLVFDVMLGINQAKAQSKRKAKEPRVDTECEDANNAVWMDSILFDKPGQSNHYSSKPTGKTIRRNSRKDCPSSSRNCLENPSGPRIIELEEATTSLPAYSGRQKRKNSIPSEPKSKGRRLVKKHTTIKDWLLTSNVGEECEEVQMVPQNKSSGILFDRSDVEMHQPSSDRRASDTTCMIDQDNTDAYDDIEEIVHVSDENQNSCAHGASSFPTSDELHEADLMDSSQVDPVEKLPASNELSCVICWTDFSSTRGVLPCGHRFCFSCIQDWADHMASRRKPSTCPLCKASFICITKMEDAASSDQKIYSQSIPNDSSKMNLYFLTDEPYSHRTSLSTPVCSRCSSREPEDLLIKCHLCQIQCVHSYCLDPPLLPWTCVHCKELQMLYLHTR